MLVCALSPLVGSSQQQQPAQTPATGQILTYRTGTRLVVLDIAVTDSAGHPVHGLRPQDFSVTEDQKPQPFQHFREAATAAPAAPPPQAPVFPPGTFTNYSPAPEGGALTVFLLDGLNTSVKDQNYAIQAMERIAQHAPEGNRIAIFGLRSRLYLLQGFTSDPTLLQSALRGRVHAGASSLLADPAGTNTDHVTTAGIAEDSIAAGRTADNNATLLAATLAQFETDDQAFETQLRIQYTLDAFEDLSRYLENLPGRKNLFWFSSAFPISLSPDPSAQNPFAGNQNNQAAFHETLNLLTSAQVSVYPVDARGLMTVPLYDAAHSGREFAHNPAAVSSQLNAFYSSQAIEHQTMAAMAEATGGQAYYNTNDLAGAIAKGMEAGANYYSLSYTPRVATGTSHYRHIHVSLNGELASRGYTLSYRRGYLEEPPAASSGGATETMQSPDENRYARLAVSHGAPAPSDIVFKVGVRPASSETEANVAPGNRLEAASHSHGPFRRYSVDFAVPPSQFTLAAEPGGRRSGKLKFSAYVYNGSGELVNTTGSTVDLNLTPETYTRFLEDATRFHLDISLPAHEPCFIRLAVEDARSNRIGAVEISSAQVDKLTPIPAQAPTQP